MFGSKGEWNMGKIIFSAAILGIFLGACDGDAEVGIGSHDGGAADASRTGTSSSTDTVSSSSISTGTATSCLVPGRPTYRPAGGYKFVSALPVCPPSNLAPGYVGKIDCSNAAGAYRLAPNSVMCFVDARTPTAPTLFCMDIDVSMGCTSAGGTREVVVCTTDGLFVGWYC